MSFRKLIQNEEVSYKLNYNELKAEIVRNGLTIPCLATAIGISKKALYQKMRGTTEFKRNELIHLKDKLYLTDERANQIFFSK